MANRIEFGCITIDHLVIGYLDNNVYIISDGEGTMIVDPSARPELILEALGGRKLDAIMCTHFHSDHTGALAEIKEKTGATVYVSEPDAFYVENPKKVGTSPVPLQAPCKVDVRVNDGDTVKVGSMEWQVIMTPGHSKGSMCWFLPPREDGLASEDKIPILLSGDTLFAGTTGRTDFLGGSLSDMQQSMERLSLLSDDTIVLTGHNDFTTIGRERRQTFPRWGVGLA